MPLALAQAVSHVLAAAVLLQHASPAVRAETEMNRTVVIASNDFMRRYVTHAGMVVQELMQMIHA